MKNWQMVARLAGTMPTHEIAERLNISVNTVISHARYLKISLAYRNARWTAEANQQLIGLHSAGLTQAVIGKRMGRTPGAVRAQLAKLRKEGKI